MVRVITNDGSCCEITLSPSSYNLINLSCKGMNTNLSPSITAIDLFSKTKNGDTLYSIIGIHENSENAHKTLFNKKADISALSNVATSGDYNDLTNKPIIPEIPEINNGTLTITQDSTTKGTFNANQGENTTINIDLSNKANTDLSNVPNSKGILTESYVNGYDWYRVYSDGWCEQGGYKNTTAAITFYKPYKDTNYTITIATNLGNGNTTAAAYTWVSSYVGGIINKTTDGFDTYGSADSSYPRSWVAYGYII